MLRLAPELHAQLRSAARETGVSLNDYCARKLSAPVSSITALAGASAVVARAVESFGENLVAIVAYGSWSRGEAVKGSDFDALIVIESEVPITRALYRDWDSRPPIVWDGHVVDPHFIHVPDDGSATTGSWAEVAIDGIVIFERGLRVSRHLARIRRDVLAGRLVRRIVHGQPYWLEVA